MKPPKMIQVDDNWIRLHHISRIEVVANLVYIYLLNGERIVTTEYNEECATAYAKELADMINS